MELQSNSAQPHEDWFSQGKDDAWAGRAKQPPTDPEAASLYDLGYSEGTIEQPSINQTKPKAEEAR
jgi:hypothetical protein